MKREAVVFTFGVALHYGHPSFWGRRGCLKRCYPAFGEEIGTIITTADYRVRSIQPFPLSKCMFGLQVGQPSSGNHIKAMTVTPDAQFRQVVRTLFTCSTLLRCSPVIAVSRLLRLASALGGARWQIGGA
uniref:Uncharacterized protein n=1 Tax=Trichuris muris TaxID=70415 RepID=A0A5S6Q9Z1_TRIMR